MLYCITEGDPSLGYLICLYMIRYYIQWLHLILNVHLVAMYSQMWLLLITAEY